MGKIAALPAGQIIKGDFYGQYLYKWDNTTWGICLGPTLENSLLAGKLYWHTADYSKSGNWFGPTNEDRVSESTVDRYDEIGSQTSGPDASAMVKGTLVGGIGLGMIVGAASTSATTDVAFYLKNGKSFVVRFSNPQAWLDLKSTLYSLENPQEINNSPQSTTLPTPDKFEAVKKYKELLDMGIISQDEFDSKKTELLGQSAIKVSVQQNLSQQKRSETEQLEVVKEIAAQAIAILHIIFGEKIPAAFSEALTHNIATYIGKELSFDEIPIQSVLGYKGSKQVDISDVPELPKAYYLNWVYRIMVITNKHNIWYCYGQFGKRNDEIGQHIIGKISFDKLPEIRTSQNKKRSILTIVEKSSEISVICKEQASHEIKALLESAINTWSF